MEKSHRRDDEEVDVADLPKNMERVSQENLSRRVIRKVNYGKAMSYGRKPEEATASTEKPAENPFAALMKQSKEKAEDASTGSSADKLKEDTPTASVEESAKKDNTNQCEKSEGEEKAVSPVGALPANEKASNPFAALLTKIKQDRQDSTTAALPAEEKASELPASNPFAFAWKSNYSFTTAATKSGTPQPEEEEPESLAEEELGDESHELSVMEDETVVARCHVKAFRFDAENKAWKELGPGILKLSVHNDLANEKEPVTSENNFGRILFHDSRNRVNRMNFPLGASLKVNPVQGDQVKKLIFSTAVQTEEGEESSCERQTFLVKQVAEKLEKPSSSGRGCGMENFREQLQAYNERITRNHSSQIAENNA